MNQNFYLLICITGLSVYVLVWQLCLPFLYKAKATTTSTELESNEKATDGFKYLPPLPPCARHVKVLIVVHTTPQRRTYREAIRKTWAKQLIGTPFHRIFLLGTFNNSDKEWELQMEQAFNVDLLQGGFPDTPTNSIYKHMLSFSWFEQHCASAQWLLKLDDNAYLNMALLQRRRNQQLLRTKQPLNATNGSAPFDMAQLFARPQKKRLWCGGKLPVRVGLRSNSTGRRVAQYRKPLPECFGYASVYSADVVRRLARTSLNLEEQYFWTDDGYINGRLARDTGLNISLWHMHKLSTAECQALLQGKEELRSLIYFITQPRQLYAFQQRYWTQQQISSNLKGSACCYIDFK